jgi:hypothetical protein
MQVTPAVTGLPIQGQKVCRTGADTTSAVRQERDQERKQGIKKQGWPTYVRARSRDVGKKVVLGRCKISASPGPNRANPLAKGPPIGPLALALLSSFARPEPRVASQLLVLMCLTRPPQQAPLFGTAPALGEGKASAFCGESLDRSSTRGGQSCFDDTCSLVLGP